MPEATVHEYSDALPCENDVCSTSDTGQRGEVNSIAQTGAVEAAAQCKLRSGVLDPLGGSFACRPQWPGIPLDSSQPRHFPSNYAGSHASGDRFRTVTVARKSRRHEQSAIQRELGAGD